MNKPTSLILLASIESKRVLPSLLGLLFFSSLSLALHAEEKSIQLQVNGEIRGRFETLDGQFRADGEGGDQGFFMRSLLHVEAVHPKWTMGVELQDSRSYLTDQGSSLSTTQVNTLDFLQIYLELPVSRFFGSSYNGSLKLGRQTMSVGSQRQIERVDFANVIFNYTGAYLALENSREDEWHLFLLCPVERRPQEFNDLLKNRHVFDREEFNRLLWAVHFRKSNAFPTVLPNIWGELFCYGQHEWDAFGNETPNRQHLTPGFRLFKAVERDEWNFDIEGALRLGTRRETSDEEDTRDLDVFASMLIFRLGYTFDHPWQPNLAFQLYHSTGDDDPQDERFGRYERLFGSSRTDLNNTGLYGPLTPSNLTATGIRFEVTPSENTTWRLTYSAVLLASDTDAFVVGRQRDPEGQSGSFVGHFFDSRLVQKLGEMWELETGASYFLHGQFMQNTPQAPEANQTAFFYTQLTYLF